MSTIGARIVEERQRLALSQEDFAALGNVGRTSQTKYEKDTRRPDADYLSALSAHGIDIFYILTGKRLERLNKISESAAEYSVRIYDSPEAALYAVLDMQRELQLNFSADQLKAVLGFAYKAQARPEELKAFIEGAYELFGKPLPNGEPHE